MYEYYKPRTLAEMREDLANNDKENFITNLPDEVKDHVDEIFDFFKTNESAKDLLIGSIGAVIGGVFIDRFLRRDKDDDK